MKPVLTLLGFDRGLTDVFDTGAHALPALPVQQLDPAEGVAQTRFEAWLGPAGFDTVIEQALHPPLPDRGLLRPGAFRGALEGACAALEHAAGTDPAHARLLQHASRLLVEDLALRDLAQRYRSALHQG